VGIVFGDELGLVDGRLVMAVLGSELTLLMGLFVTIVIVGIIMLGAMLGPATGLLVGGLVQVDVGAKVGNTLVGREIVGIQLLLPFVEIVGMFVILRVGRFVFKLVGRGVGLLVGTFMYAGVVDIKGCFDGFFTGFMVGLFVGFFVGKIVIGDSAGFETGNGADRKSRLLVVLLDEAASLPEVVVMFMS
jgi:hypothetical protein